MAAIQDQPEVNIGLAGHVDHGKTTLTQALSGHWTDTHSEEKKRGISIKLGYADTTFYCTEDGTHYPMGKHPDGIDDAPEEKLRTVSFVDSPGHETLMATMISGASIMDGAMLLIAANEKCPQPQTREHLMALDIAGIENVIIVQNKIDLVSKERALESYQEIKQFLKGTVAEKAAVIPVSAHHDVNLDILIKAIEEFIPTPKRELNAPPQMFLARSFDTNRPGARPAELKGGILGGSIVQGAFKVGDKIEIAPGRKVEDEKGQAWAPITTEIIGLHGGGMSLEEMAAGGLCGMATTLDPALTTSDNLSGQVVAKIGGLPPIRNEVDIEIKLLDKMVDLGDAGKKVDPLRNNEMLMVNVATATSVGVTNNVKGKSANLKLRLPICAEEGTRITLSRRIGPRWRLIGFGIIR